MKITLVSDNPNSWIIPYVKKLAKLLKDRKHKVVVVDHPKKIKRGDLVFLLGCEKIVKPNVLRLNKHNIVIHESALPKGKGWSPLTWQILEGKNKIPIYLFEANEKVDSGPIYLKDEMNFDGSELLKQLKNTQGKKTIKLALNYVDNLNGMKGVKQTGKSTFYKKRTSEDSRLDLNKKLGDQFNLLRVCDNKRYPAFFDYLGHRYVIKIYKNDKTSK